MSSKLCFNCFEKVAEVADKCENCGVLLTDKIKIASRVGGKLKTVGVETNYEEEVERLEEIRKLQDGQVGYSARMRKKDLFKIAIITSILGILQIYTAGLLDSINEVSVILGEKKITDGFPLMISGFAYFLGIIGFYLNFRVFRRIYLIANIIHLWTLYRIYETLDLFAYVGKNFDRSEFPPQLREFFDNIEIFQYLMFAFAFCYVFQIFYLYRHELQTTLIRRCRR